jgi:transposase
VAELETAVEKNNSSSKRDNSDWRRRYLEVEGRLREYDDLKEQHLKLKDELKQAKKVQLQQHEQRRIVRDLENQISTLKFTPIAMLEDQNR